MDRGTLAAPPRAGLTMRGKKWAIIPVIVVVVMLLLRMREPILFAIGDFLVIQDALQPADVIHVIAGPDDRTDYAIQLYKQGYSNVIFFTGGWCTYHGYYHGQHGAERAEAQGVDPASIAIDESPVTSTYDPYHMRRAQWLYRQVLGPGVKLEMAPVPFEVSPYQRRWWVDAESRSYVKDEYLKLVYNYVRYRLSWGPLRTWLASLDTE